MSNIKNTHQLKTPSPPQKTMSDAPPQTRDALLSELRALSQRPHLSYAEAHTPALSEDAGQRYWSIVWGKLLRLLNAWPDEEREVAVSAAYALATQLPTSLRHNLSSPPLLTTMHGLMGSVYTSPSPTQDERLLYHPERLPHVDTLIVHSATSLESFSALLKTPLLKQIKHLSLDFRPTTAEHLRAIFDAGLNHHLEQLSLYRYSALGVEGAAMLASQPWPKLEALSLMMASLGDAGLEALLKTRAFPKLHTLKLKENALTAKALDALDLLPTPPSMLDLEHNQGQARLVKQLGQRPWAVALTHLNLGDNALNDLAIKQLASASNLRNLQQLHLNQAGQQGWLTEASANALASSPHLGELTHLSLENFRLGDAGLRRILLSPRLGALQHLNVSHCDLRLGDSLGTIQQAQLADHPLRALILDFNAPIQAADLSALSWPPNLTTLGLHGVTPTPSQLGALRHAPFISKLVTLDLSRTPATDEHTRALAALPMSQLEQLQLGSFDVRLSAQGAQQLINAPWFKTLLSLNLTSEGDAVWLPPVHEGATMLRVALEAHHIQPY